MNLLYTIDLILYPPNISVLVPPVSLQQHEIQTIQQFQILKKDISIRLSHPKEVKMVPQPPWSPVHTSQSKTLNHQTITKHKVSNEPQYNRHAYNQSRHGS